MTGPTSEDENMATKNEDTATKNPNSPGGEPGDVTGEETEPQAFVDPGGEDEDSFNGIEGQIQYPDRHVDAERAAGFAAYKVDNLDPRAEDDPAYESGWENPADRHGEEHGSDEEKSDRRSARGTARSSKSKEKASKEKAAKDDK